ncbi:MAG: bifunctional alpha,alpha-trehalose-phosphate synthase (UDP-forming)/trehalose-phosphatase [Bacteroidales bacterium]|nr:bifunctional alpha,alpha-trehalose-phosphate synthase (UDP-forming)/trehalose-phosphatase [Bacteroidales bacterium]
MSKIIIVSNRLPVNIQIENGEILVQASVGGVATGMQSIHDSANSIWIGWSGLTVEETPKKVQANIDTALQKEKCIPVPLTEEDIEKYYYGFSNKTIWPLFHYFTQYTEYEQDTWDAYQDVNKKFADIVLKHVKKGDKLWIHDYQLLLLPKMIKEKRPDVCIGFFLHIPFPSFEVFRIIPWRKEIIEGMLGADLIGFHIYDYERHFFSSVRRLLGYEISFNKIDMVDRIVVADSFPMGIDYDKFHQAALTHKQRSIKDRSKIQQDLDKHVLMREDVKLVLSIDRLDYTKGIANRLYAFEYFLKQYPKFLEKVTLIMLSVPSRSNVEHYQLMKSEVDELVGRINGQYSTIEWSPIWYFYRALPFENLIDLYTSCDVALITPIRDGMNLVAKEYIASRTDQKGVLILSEMAGAAKEMGEAIVINPNNYGEIADALNEALTMSDEEQIGRNTSLQKRLKRYNIEKWANDFMDSLSGVEAYRARFLVKKLSPAIQTSILKRFKKAEKRIFFLDYDGTLVGFQNRPEDAIPDNQLYDILDKLASNKKNRIVLISGRDKETFTKWFGHKNYSLIAEHGVWMKPERNEWRLIEPMNVEWKEIIRPVLESYVDRTPGSFIEEKNYSLVWHYRKSDHELGVIRSNEMKDELTSLIANHNLEILEGNKVIEVKNSGVNKGRAAIHKLADDKYDFIIGIGDDWTDEYLFEELPSKAFTIKVGMKNTYAKYNVESYNDVRKLLNRFVQ